MKISILLGVSFASVFFTSLMKETVTPSTLLVPRTVCAEERVQCDSESEIKHASVKVCFTYDRTRAADDVVWRGKATDASLQAGRSACGIKIVKSFSLQQE